MKQGGKHSTTEATERNYVYKLCTTNLQHHVFLAQFSCNILDNFAKSLLDNFAKSPMCFLFVIPAKAGIQ